MNKLQSLLKAAHFFQQASQKSYKQLYSRAVAIEINLDISEDLLPQATSLFNSIQQTVANDPSMEEQVSTLQFVINHLTTEINNPDKSYLVTPKYFAKFMETANAALQTMIQKSKEPATSKLTAYQLKLKDLISKAMQLPTTETTSRFIIGAPINKKIQQDVSDFVASLNLYIPLLNINGVIDKDTQTALQKASQYFNKKFDSVAQLHNAIKQEMANNPEKFNPAP